MEEVNGGLWTEQIRKKVYNSMIREICSLQKCFESDLQSLANLWMEIPSIREWILDDWEKEKEETFNFRDKGVNIVNI